MKKALSILIILATMVMLFSCSGSTNTLIDLKDNEALILGNSSTPLVNYKDTDTQSYNLSYVTDVTYTLNRSYYSTSSGILYDGYYYYWGKNETTDTEVLGTQTTTYAHKYSYLAFVENESILVKMTTTRTTSFSFKGGWISKDVTVNYNLGGYFADLEELKNASADIYNMIDHSTTRKYYVDTTVPEYKTTSTNSYNNFYYIEKR